MNLKKFANVDSLYRDLNTGQEVPWHDYMRRVIDKLGLDDIKPYIPYEIDYLKEKLKEDVHLNNTTLQRWDEASGFCFHRGEPYYTACGLSILFRRNGITCFSPSDGVCVLKEAARILCETT